MAPAETVGELLVDLVTDIDDGKPLHEAVAQYERLITAMVLTQWATRMTERIDAELARLP